MKAIALLVFLATLAGATYGVHLVLGDNVSGQLLAVDSPKGELNATAGHTVTYPVTVYNRGEEARAFTLVLEGAGASARAGPFALEGKADWTYFVPFDVPPGAAAGAHEVNVLLLDEAEQVVRERSGLLRLRVLGEGIGFAPGDAAQVIYTGRIAETGRVFNTNNPALASGRFPTTESYRFTPGLLAVSGDAWSQATVVPGFYNATLGMQPGEARTVTLEVWDAYRNATFEVVQDREERIERRMSLPLEEQEVGRGEFDAYMNQTGQMDPATAQAGDGFTILDGNNRWPYVVTQIDSTTVHYRLAPEEGGVYTLYPFWPDGSVVVEATPTRATFFTTPTTALGENVTMRQAWGNTSVLVDVTEDEVVVRHNPAVGAQFRYSPESGGPTYPSTVTEVTGERIVFVMQNEHPLAGRRLTFDIEMASLERG